MSKKCKNCEPFGGNGIVKIGWAGEEIDHPCPVCQPPKPKAEVGGYTEDLLRVDAFCRSEGILLDKVVKLYVNKPSKSKAEAEEFERNSAGELTAGMQQKNIEINHLKAKNKRLEEVVKSLVDYPNSEIFREWKEEYIPKTPTNQQVDFYQYQQIKAKLALKEN